MPSYFLLLTELWRLQASRGGATTWTSPPPTGIIRRATPVGVFAPLGGTLGPHRAKEHRGSSDYQMTAYLGSKQVVGESYYPSLQPCHHPLRCSSKNAPTRWTRYPWGRFSSEFLPPNDQPTCGSPEHAGLREPVSSLHNSQMRLFSRCPLCPNLSGVVCTHSADS